jgi:hypothetical protein
VKANLWRTAQILCAPFVTEETTNREIFGFRETGLAVVRRVRLPQL